MRGHRQVAGFPAHFVFATRLGSMEVMLQT